MPTSTQQKVLLTGVTGFIGGSVLTSLLQSQDPALKDATITLLLRGPDRFEKLTSAYGDRVKLVEYESLDDTEKTIAVAAEHDIVINTTLGYHTSSATALVQGLAQRKQKTGRDVWIIHTSGTSNLGDQHLSKKYVESDPNKEFDDATGDIYNYEKEREALEAYSQRTTELSVIDEGLKLGVKTLVIMSPTIYGKGTGLFNKTSIQIPLFIRAVLKHEKAFTIGSGSGVWDHVHMVDLADLYKIAVLDILNSDGQNLPWGKKGIIFSANGRHTWRELYQAAAYACQEAGKIKSAELEEVSLEEGTVLAMGSAEHTQLIELGFTSNSKTISTIAKQLGWKPAKGEEAWKQAFKEDFEAVAQE